MVPPALSHTFAPDLSSPVSSVYKERARAALGTGNIPCVACAARAVCALWVWPRLQVQKIDVKGRRGSATASDGVQAPAGGRHRGRVAVLTRASGGGGGRPEQQNTRT